MALIISVEGTSLINMAFRLMVALIIVSRFIDKIHDATEKVKKDLQSAAKEALTSFGCRSFQPRQPRFGIARFQPIGIGVLPNFEKMFITRHRLGGQAFLLV